MEFSLENFRFIKHLRDDLLITLVDLGITEIEKRYFMNTTEESDRNLFLSAIMNLKSKLFLLESTINGKSLDPKTYTPMRANQMELALILGDPNSNLKSKEIFMDFVTKFWTTCKCKRFCCSKAPFTECFKIYEKYAKLNDSARSISIGPVLENCMKIPDAGTNERLRYNYSILDVAICPKFFRMIYNLTESQLDFLQSRIKRNEHFEHKKKGNHKVSEERYKFILIN